MKKNRKRAIITKLQHMHDDSGFRARIIPAYRRVHTSACIRVHAGVHIGHLAMAAMCDCDRLCWSVQR